MYNFHRRINKKEKIVGWYTTTTAEGVLLNDNSSLIQNFYSSECENPVHLVVDTTLAGEDMGVRGFMSQSMVLGESNLANKFLEIKVDLEVTDSEATCLYHMINAQNTVGKQCFLIGDHLVPQLLIFRRKLLYSPTMEPPLFFCDFFSCISPFFYYLCHYFLKYPSSS